MSIESQRKELNVPANQQPTYTAYTVSRREGKDDFWIAIGAAFMHQDGDGFNIVLQALPIDGKIVLRLPKAQGERPDDQGAEAQRASIRAENHRRKSSRK
jgi:hypothetical protein